MSNKTINNLQNINEVRVSDLFAILRPGAIEANNATIEQLLVIIRQVLANDAFLENAGYNGNATPGGSPTGGHDPGYWTTVEPGTYTNFGGVVVSANNFAVISVYAGVYTVSQQALSMTYFNTLLDALNASTVKKTELYKPAAADVNLLTSWASGYWGASASAPTADATRRASNLVNITPGQTVYLYNFTRTAATVGALYIAAGTRLTNIDFTDLTPVAGVPYAYTYLIPASSTANRIGITATATDNYTATIMLLAAISDLNAGKINIGLLPVNGTPYAKLTDVSAVQSKVDGLSPLLGQYAYYNGTNARTALGTFLLNNAGDYLEFTGVNAKADADADSKSLYMFGINNGVTTNNIFGFFGFSTIYLRGADGGTYITWGLPTGKTSKELHKYKLLVVDASTWELFFDGVSLGQRARTNGVLNVTGVGHVGGTNYAKVGLTQLAISDESTVTNWDINGLVALGGNVVSQYYLLPIASAVSSTQQPYWFNRYPNIMAKLKRFARLIMNEDGLTAERAINVIMWGDSIFARETHTSISTVTPNSYPPGLTTKNLGAYLYENFRTTQKTILMRYDKAGIFTETGTFAVVSGIYASWDDSDDRPIETKQSVSTNAAISFVVPAGTPYFNFIDRTSNTGATVVTITISAGNGVVQRILPGSFVEANASTFSQRQTTDSVNRIGNTTYGRPNFFKVLNTASDITVTITKTTASGDYLLYWGVEFVPIATQPYVRIMNVARGGHNFAQLVPYMDSDVIARKPDLIILEIPLLNMYGTDKTKAYNVNWVWDVIYGDRPGFENTWNLKTRSNNWTDFEVLVILPHISRGSFNADGTPIVNTNVTPADVTTAPIVWGAVKAFLISRGDLPFIDMYSVFRRYADTFFNGNYYAATTSSGITGKSLLDDDTHQNDLGTLVFAENICPAVCDVNTY